MRRRTFLGLVGASTVAIGSSPFSSRAEAQNPSIIRELPPAATKRVAWTIDDGTSPESLAAHIRLASEEHLRLTFFVYSKMDSWTECKSELKPLVARGQIQLANHTSSHPYLTQLSAAQIQKELMRAHNFIEKEYEVDARPYFRPPYGSISRRVIEAAAEVGYTKPVLWTKTLGDANKNSSLERISQLADSGFEGQAIVLSHANGMLVTRAFPHIMKQIESKDLKLLTVADVFTKGF